MVITLDIFSGRPNPSWTISEDQQRKIFDRVRGRALAPVEPPGSRLGFRGLVVQVSDDTVSDIPRAFRVGYIPTGGESIVTKGERPLNRAEDDDIVKTLLATAERAVPDDLQQLVVDEQARLSSALPLPWPPLDPSPPEPNPTPCSVVNTAYNPGFWNNDWYVQYNNNCYNYAMNWLTNTFAQPGRISGYTLPYPPTCANVDIGASKDGCTIACKGTVKRVALVIWPGWDYHWYRKHSNGFWGHKPGGTPARNTDNSNRVIDGTTLTPANCDRGGYTIFCNYRHSPHGMRVW